MLNQQILWFKFSQFTEIVYFKTWKLFSIVFSTSTSIRAVFALIQIGRLSMCKPVGDQIERPFPLEFFLKNRMP